MFSLTKDVIKREIADSKIIYKRGEDIFSLGNYYLKEADFERQSFQYYIDGNYGDYDVKVDFDNGNINYSCNCPYYSNGCKHTVAVCLDIIEQVSKFKAAKEKDEIVDPGPEKDQMSFEEIKKDALERRKKSALSEKFQITLGETYKGEHLLTNVRGKEYLVTLHSPEEGQGHCTCPDFNSNRLGTCKHLIHLHTHLKSRKDFAARIKKESFPFVHIYWDSFQERPRYYYDHKPPDPLLEDFGLFFDENGLYNKDGIGEIYPLLEKVKDYKGVKVDGHILKKVDNALFQKEVESLKESYRPDYSAVDATLYPYQKEGVEFALFKRSAIIADEMGLGKTLQAITLAVSKKDIFNFTKVLVVTPASLKEQWRREIERFTDEKVTVVAGNRDERQKIYSGNQDYFKITNYEAVLRDNLAIHRFSPDLVILDEAQRIKNFETKTSQAIKSIPYKQSIVLTGTPLENKLEDIYSIVQFADQEMLAPLWEFAAKHFILKKKKKDKIFGYRNLDSLHQELKPLIIRRKKEDVLDDLP